jgi:hypothetical protein
MGKARVGPVDGVRPVSRKGNRYGTKRHIAVFVGSMEMTSDFDAG